MSNDHEDKLSSKKEVKELRQRIKYALANYTDDMDGALFGNGSVGLLCSSYSVVH